jgi:rhomboid protease GluP
MQNKLSLSHLLVWLSILFTLLSFMFPGILVFWMNHYFLVEKQYFQLFIQIYVSQFLHGDIFHLLFNSVFIFYFWVICEQILWVKKYMLFFFLASIFLAVLILTFGSGNTIGISGFVMALLSFYTLELWSKKNPEFRGGITALVINILIWLSPWVSFLGHLWGAIFGAMYWIWVRKRRS